MPLTPAETRLHSVLADYLKMAGSARPAPAGDLKGIFLTLDALESELSPQLDPRLRHFLESKSYRKAYDYLSALSSTGLANPATPRQACSQ